MKLIVAFIVSALLASSGAFAFANDVSGGAYGDRPMDPRGHAEDIFLARLPAGADKAAKNKQVMGVKVDDMVGTTVVSKQTEEKLGKVRGVIVDEGGAPLALVMHIEEGPGIMARDIAVDWKAVRSERDAQNRVVVNVDVAFDQLRHAPEFVAGI